MAYNPFTKYHEHPGMYKYIYIYTWNPNDLYFLKVNPPKHGLFPSKQGSFGFQVYIYIVIFCSTLSLLSFFAPGFKLASYKSDVTETASACEDKLFLFESEN